MAPSKTVLIVSGKGPEDQLRFDSARTSLVESLSGEDDNSNSRGGGITYNGGQSVLVNLKMTGGSMYSNKQAYDNINQSTISKNPFEDSDNS